MQGRASRCVLCNASKGAVPTSCMHSPCKRIIPGRREGAGPFIQIAPTLSIKTKPHLNQHLPSINFSKTQSCIPPRHRVLNVKEFIPPCYLHLLKPFDRVQPHTPILAEEMFNRMIAPHQNRLEFFFVTFFCFKTKESKKNATQIRKTIFPLLLN